jgi:hypothetical protein
VDGEEEVPGQDDKVLAIAHQHGPMGLVAWRCDAGILLQALYSAATAQQAAISAARDLSTITLSGHAALAGQPLPSDETLRMPSSSLKAGSDEAETRVSIAIYTVVACNAIAEELAEAFEGSTETGLAGFPKILAGPDECVRLSLRIPQPEPITSTDYEPEPEPEPLLAFDAAEALWITSEALSTSAAAAAERVSFHAEVTTGLGKLRGRARGLVPP